MLGPSQGFVRRCQPVRVAPSSGATRRSQRDEGQIMAESRQFQATAQIPQLIEMLASQDLDDRLAAIQNLGEIGDEQALNELLARMTPPLEEYYALSVAVGRLRKRLGTR